jgi:integrase/recombinase XerD
MTPLRQRMLEDMQLRGFSPRTQEAYVRAVHQLAAHFHRSPDRLGEDELRQYFLYLTNVKHFALPVSPLRCAGSSSSTSGP